MGDTRERRPASAGPADWPYDADRDDPLTALRIPVITNPYTARAYEVAVVITAPDSASDLWGPALRPDERETAQITAYLGWRMGCYNSSWKARMRARPLDTDPSTNTVILQKRGPGDWCYRRRTWRSGPHMIPVAGKPTLTLEQLLDRVCDITREKWQLWKAAHPEAFGTTHQEGNAR
jgi:hypothetical protein